MSQKKHKKKCPPQDMSAKTQKEIPPQDMSAKKNTKRNTIFHVNNCVSGVKRLTFKGGSQHFSKVGKFAGEITLDRDN